MRGMELASARATKMSKRYLKRHYSSSNVARNIWCSAVLEETIERLQIRCNLDRNPFSSTDAKREETTNYYNMLWLYFFLRASRSSLWTRIILLQTCIVVPSLPPNLTNDWLHLFFKKIKKQISFVFVLSILARSSSVCLKTFLRCLSWARAGSVASSATLLSHVSPQKPNPSFYRLHHRLPARRFWPPIP